MRIAVVGTGLIGRRHIELVAREAELAAVVDPRPEMQAIAGRYGVPWHASAAELLASDRPDGAIVATPNQMHVEHGRAFVAAGVPVLIEKPIADKLADAEMLVRDAEAAGVPILVGHHRRHNPLVRRAKETIESGRIGKIVAAHFMSWVYKPDDYFAAAWRRAPGAGPVLINLIHDIDLLRHLCGEVAAVQAMESSAARVHEVEDSASVLLRFRNGAIGTATVSDTIVAPWSWELTAGENPAYPQTGEPCCWIGGTEGSLSIPDLGRWHQAEKRSWWEPIARESTAFDRSDPLALQIRQFSQVVLGLEEPLVSGREGLATLKVVLAIKEAARSKSLVEIR